MLLLVLAVPPPVESGDPDGILSDYVVEVLGGVLDVMGDVLTWNFAPARPGKRATLLRTTTMMSAPTTLCPGRTWRDVLILSGLPSSCFEVYATLRYFHATDIPLRARNVIVQVC